MKLTFLELRRNPGKLLEALERGEEVTLTRRGKDLARILPAKSSKKKSNLRANPAFGMWADHADMEDPGAFVRRIRKGRFDDL